MKWNRWIRVVCAAWMAAMFALIVYKAAALSITIDEASTYNNWVDAPWKNFVTVPGYNNHPLNTLLCRFAVSLLGVSEFSLRLPNILGGLVFFFAVYRISLLLFGPTAWAALCVALNTGNPFLLDHFATARGYGLGVALWTLGAYWGAKWMAEDAAPFRLLAAASAAFGLAFSAFLTEIFAVAASFGALLLVAGRVKGWRAARQVVMGGCLAAAVALPAAWPRLRLARRDGLDGEAHYLDGLRTFFNFLFDAQDSLLPLNELAWKAVHEWAAPAFLLLLALLLIATVWRWTTDARRHRLTLLFSLSLLLSFFLLWAEPALARHVFFGQRRLLFAVPLMGIALTLWARALPSGTGAVVVLALGCLQSTQFETRIFSGWRFDAGARDIARAIAARKPNPLPDRVAVACSWFASHSFNFYRRIYGMRWITESNVARADCYANFYILSPGDLAVYREKFDLEEVYRDPVSQTALAVPGAKLERHLEPLRTGGVTSMPGCAFRWGNQTPSLAAGHAGGGANYLQDVMSEAETQKEYWTGRRPVYVLRADRAVHRRFRFEYVIHGAILDRTGPLRLQVRINGVPVGEVIHKQAGEFVFERPLPQNVFRDDGIAVVAAEVDRHFISDLDGAALGYVFRRMEFLP